MQTADMTVELPPCPTCGGDDQLHTYRCPDCVDGKVSIEQLVATFNAVHAEDGQTGWTGSTAHHHWRRWLRSVKP